MSATHQTECWCGEQHRWEPMEVALCDSDGIVRRGAMHRGTDYECTGSAHWSGFHIRCTSPAHVPAGVPVTGAAPDRRQDQRACDRCDGSGVLLTDNPHGLPYGIACPRCAGTGQHEDTHVIDVLGDVWLLVRDGGMATRATYEGIISIGINALEAEKGPLLPFDPKAYRREFPRAEA